jgi:hypothetical protein
MEFATYCAAFIVGEIQGRGTLASADAHLELLPDS